MYENVKNDSQWSLICFSENVEQLFDKNSKRRNVIMEIAPMLAELRAQALNNHNLWQELMDTRKAEQPLAAFCAKCREL